MRVQEKIWMQKYRPKKLDEVVLPLDIKKEIHSYIDKKDIPNLIFSGTAGLGKTTCAKIIIDELEADYIEINGSLDTSIDEVRSNVMRFSTTVSLTAKNPVKIVFITEADGFSTQAQNSLKNVIETFSKNVRFIFDTNHPEKLVDPLKSRCVELEFDPSTEEYPNLMREFMKRGIYILESEGIKFDKKVLADIIKTNYPDMRKIVNDLQKFSVSGELIQGQSSSDEQLKELLVAMKSKKYQDIRTAVTNVTNPDNMILKLFSNMDKIFKKEDVPQVVLILAEANFQSGFCISKEINFLSAITKLVQSGVSINV